MENSTIIQNWKALIKPNKLNIKSNEDKTITTLIAEPLEKGYALTIGNSLRRILLSSIQGSAISEGATFLDCVNDLFLFQHVRSPTRFRTGQTPSLLDLVLTKEKDSIPELSIGAPIGKSDHASITFQMMIDTEQENKEEKYTRRYYKADYGVINNKHKNINWEDQMQNVSGELAWKFLENALLDCVNEFVPLQK